MVTMSSSLVLFIIIRLDGDTSARVIIGPGASCAPGLSKLCSALAPLAAHLGEAAGSAAAFDLPEFENFRHFGIEKHLLTTANMGLTICEHSAAEQGLRRRRQMSAWVNTQYIESPDSDAAFADSCVMTRVSPAQEADSALPCGCISSCSSRAGGQLGRAVVRVLH